MMTSLAIGFLLLIILAAFILFRRHLNRIDKHYHTLFNDSPVALIELDEQWRIVEWNPNAQMIFGWDESEAIGRNILDLIVPPSDYEHVRSILTIALDEGKSNSKNFNVTKDRQEIFCEWQNSRINGNHSGIICMAQNITETKRDFDELSKRSIALESSGEAILYTDHHGYVEFANHSFYALCSPDEKEILGRHIGEYLFGTVSAMSSILGDFDDHNTWQGTITKACSNGERVFSVVLSAIYAHNRLVSYIANFHDITEISSHVDALTHQACHDPLTGVTNRSVMDDRLHHAIDRAERADSRIALFFVDLNDFKQINDQYGHEAGDKILTSIASSLRSALRNSDTISRFGGDEFVIIIEDIENDDHVQTVMNAIEFAIADPIAINETTAIQAKASIGLALYPDDATDADSLIKAADTSMYIKKKEKNKKPRAKSASRKKNLLRLELALYSDSSESH